jgi:hypothetical protein
MKNPIVDVLDVMTSKSSTLPYDDDIMKRMIVLVQKAKSTPVKCKERIGWLTCSSEAKGGLPYYTAATSEYAALLLFPHYSWGHSARLLSFFGKPRILSRPGRIHRSCSVQHIGGSYTSMDRSMRGLSGTKLCMTNRNVKDRYLSLCYHHCFSLLPRFIYEKWRDYGQTKSLLKQFGRAS